MHPQIEQVLELPNTFTDIGFVLNTNGSVRRDLDDKIVAGGWLVAILFSTVVSAHDAYTSSRSYEGVVRRIERLAADLSVHVYCVLHDGKLDVSDVHHVVYALSRCPRWHEDSRVHQSPRPFGRQARPASTDVIEQANVYAAGERLDRREAREFQLSLPHGCGRRAPQ